MNIQVKINGTDATGYTLEYSRNKKICTGIGTLQLTISKNYTATINPGDIILIYENGSLVGTYIINTENKDDPSANRVFEAQDGSKRLTDYFIAEIYTIDNPINVSYYIKKFITDCGLTYSVDSLDTTGLLPNGTILGHMSAYEQILQLLQLSNWYFYFDNVNVCHLGKLSKDLSVIDASYDRTDIINIKTVKDDKILRNRAVVWGTGNPSNYTWVFADVQTQTRWNHDSKDVRTAVFGSSNIPNIGSAYILATQMLNAFARISYTKEIQLWGARNQELGKIVYISSNIYNGSGLITTYQVDMTKSGLTTTIILDEFCPRIFGWYDFGDYVYIGTNGSGVWRKHLKLDGTWYNYSTGLGNLTVTDLYKNNGILSCVTSDGSLYRSNDKEGVWSKISIPTLTTVSGVSVSGVMVRAVTQDRNTNSIHAAVDNRPGLNSSNYGFNPSGIITNMSGYYTWVVEAQPNYGNIIASHPVAISGFSGFVVFDIDNDGANDYISVFTTTSGNGGYITFDGTQYSFGSKTSVDNNYAPMSTSLTDSKDYNSSGQHVRISNTGYIMSAFIVDNKDDRGIAFLGTIQSDSTAWFYWQPVVLSSGNIYLPSYFNKQVTIPKDTSYNVTRVVAILRASDKVTFNIYYYVMGGGTGLKKIAINTSTGAASYSTVITPFYEPLILQTIGAPDHWGAEEDIKNDRYWYFAYTTYAGGTTHHFSCVDLLGETQTDLLSVTLPAGFLSPTGIFYWGVSGLIGGEPLVFSDAFASGGCNVSYAYLDSVGDLWVGDKNGGPTKIRSNPFGTMTNVVTYWQSGPNQVDIDYFQRYLWVEWRRIFPSDSYYLSTTIFTNGGISESLQGPQVGGYTIDTTVINGYYTLENDPLTYLQNYSYYGPYTTHWYYAPGNSDAGAATIPAGYTVDSVANTQDSNINAIYTTATRTSDSKKVILLVDTNGSKLREIIFDWYYSAGWTSKIVKIFGNFVITIRTLTTNDYYASTGPAHANYQTDKIGNAGFVVDYINNDTSVNISTFGANTYLVLRRDGETYTPVKSGYENYFRLDLSNGFPLTVITSGEKGMTFIATNSGAGTSILNSTDTKFINDFRYTRQDTGSAYLKEQFYNISGGIYTLDISDVNNISYNSKALYYSSSGGGTITALETSNFQLPAQYLFAGITTGSGITFVQQDATAISGGFLPYNTNLPQSQINIIRLDDYL